MDLCIYDKCNNRCRMCTNPDAPWPAWDGSFDYGYDALVSRLEHDRARFEAEDSIYLTGGEPTIHPDFLRILIYIKDNFPAQRIKLLTNGRCFSYSDFTQKILNVSNNFEIDLSIYGPNEAVHDSITRSRGSFRQTAQGLHNLLTHKSPRQVVGVRFVIIRPTYEHIRDFLAMLIAEGFNAADRVILVFWEAEAQAVKNIGDIGVDFAAVRPYLEKAYPLFEKFDEIRLYHFPLCTIPEKLWPFAWRTLPAQEVTFLPACAECGYKQLCLGIQKTYLDHVDDKSFAPLKRDIEIEESGDIYRPIKSLITRNS